MNLRFLASLSFALGAFVSAQTVKNCPSEADGACYQVNVPASTASSGKGDIYFQISAPSSMQWVAMGQGDGMPGADIFVLYQSADGKNVTISPRLGVGYVMPNFNPDAKVTLVDGTGIQNGMMTANVRCSSCMEWQGGSLDVKSSRSSWIWAVKDGDPIKSNDQSATIVKHDNMGQMSFDLSKASGGSSLNPFMAAPAASSAASGSPSSPSSSSSPSSPPQAYGGSQASGDSQASEGSEMMSSSMLKTHRVLIAHGVIMTLSFVIFFPAGALIIRFLHVPKTAWIHGAFQDFTLAMELAGFGLGIYLGVNTEGFMGPHQIIGIIVTAFILFQPILGIIHHKMYVKEQRRTAFGHVHVWLGRLILILGWINGGLGLRLADNSQKGKIAYGVITGIVGVSYIALVSFSESRKSRGSGSQTGEKLTGNRASTAVDNGHGSPPVETSSA